MPHSWRRQWCGALCVTAWRSILCVLCSRTFSSRRCYQLHHKHSHLLEFDHDCSTCGLGFSSRRSFEAHHCVPQRRRVNVRKRQVLAARMREKMRATPEPYFVFVDSDNRPMAYAGDGEANVDSERPFADETDSSCSVDRLAHVDAADGDSFLQNDPFQLSDGSAAVLSCLPQCERELLHPAALETLSTELEMDVSDSLELQDDDDDGAAVEPSSTLPASDEDRGLAADVDDGGALAADSRVVSEAVDDDGFSGSHADASLYSADLQSGSEVCLMFVTKIGWKY